MFQTTNQKITQVSWIHHMLHPAIEPIEQLHPLAKLDFKNAFKNTTLNHKDLAKIVKNRWIQRFTVTLNDDKLKPHGFTQT